MAHTESFLITSPTIIRHTPKDVMLRDLKEALRSSMLSSNAKDIATLYAGLFSKKAWQLILTISIITIVRHVTVVKVREYILGQVE